MNSKEKKQVFIVHENAVSEAIGFLLIFTLVMMGIGLITLYGYPILLEQQSNANVRNMERDMIVLQNDMKSLAYKNVPYKETSLQVSGGALAVYNYSITNSKFTISSSNATIDTTLQNDNLDENICGHLIYESDGGEDIVMLENGAVLIRQEFQQGSSMLAEPRWFIDESGSNKTFIITFMNISTDSAMSRNGIGTVKMKLSATEFYPFEDPAGMNIDITYTKESNKFNFTKGWSNYFVNTLDMIDNSGTYRLEDVTTLVIKRYTLEIQGI